MLYFFSGKKVKSAQSCSVQICTWCHWCRFCGRHTNSFGKKTYTESGAGLKLNYLNPICLYYILYTSMIILCFRWWYTFFPGPLGVHVRNVNTYWFRRRNNYFLCPVPVKCNNKNYNNITTPLRASACVARVNIKWLRFQKFHIRSSCYSQKLS